MQLLQNCVALYHTLFNIKFAAISAIANGGIVMWVNWSYGPEMYVVAGICQSVASFFSTGFTARIVQYFSLIRSPFRSYFLGSLVPALCTFSISISAHAYNGTPELLWSCMPATAISYFTSYITNFITRHGYMLPGNYRRNEPS